MNESTRRQSVTVRIAGEDYIIRSNADPDYTTRCARFVDERIRDVREKSGLVESHKAAILAGLSITDQFFQMKEELEALRKEVVSRSNNLTARIEESS